MKKLLFSLLVAALIGLPSLLNPYSARADDKANDEGRMKEILDIPDDIPQDLLDRAECVIVMPSVLKAAFVVGGSGVRRHPGLSTSVSEAKYARAGRSWQILLS